MRRGWYASGVGRDVIFGKMGSGLHHTIRRRSQKNCKKVNVTVSFQRIFLHAMTGSKCADLFLLWRVCLPYLPKHASVAHTDMDRIVPWLSRSSKNPEDCEQGHRSRSSTASAVPSRNTRVSLREPGRAGLVQNGRGQEDGTKISAMTGGH